MWIDYFLETLHKDGREYEHRKFRYSDEVVFKYDDLVISNTEGASHIIPELFLKVVFYNSTESGHPQHDVHVQGARMKYLDTEIYSQYRHSHLNTGIYPNFTPFCIGESPLLYYRGGLTKPSQDESDLLLIVIDSFVAHESIEGGPYMYFKKVIKEPGNQISDPHTYMTSVDYNGLIPFEIHNQTVTVQRSWLETILEPDCCKVGDKYYAKGSVDQIIDTEWFFRVRDSDKTQWGNFYYNGIKQEFTIIPTGEATNFIEVVHPKTIEKYAQYIERDLKLFLCAYDPAGEEIQNASTEVPVDTDDVLMF